MLNEYRIEDIHNIKAISNYTFEDDKTVVFQKLKELPRNIQTQNVKTEFELAKCWCDFAEQALGEDEYAESKQVCWYGHYELFGRVMLEIMRLSRDKESYKDKPYLYEMIPDLDDLEFIGEPTGTEDRTFYRIWFRYIGHNDFQYPRILNMESENYGYWEFLINYVANKINYEFTEMIKDDN